MSLQVLHRDTLALGGFAGLKEHRLLMDPRLFGRHANPNTWAGIANLVYLSDAQFNPHGETHLHDHKEIDVISIMLDGRLQHQGSLESGRGLKTGDVQVQRADGEGFSHNEINPDKQKNRMLQLWVLPEQAGEPASYRFYQPEQGQVSRIYGGSTDQTDTLASHTIIEVARLNAQQSYQLNKPCIAYLATGKGKVNDTTVQSGDLFQDSHLNFKAEAVVQLILIYQA